MNAREIVAANDKKWGTFLGTCVNDEWLPPSIELREAITTAITEARREASLAMREQCAKVACTATRNIEPFENDVLYPTILGRNQAAHEIEDAINALSPDLPAGMGWLPISEAPKDNTAVIVAVPSMHKSGEFIVGEAYFAPSADHSDGGEWWWAGTGEGDYYASPIHDTNNYPTQWCPLPAPPAEEGRG